MFNFFTNKLPNIPLEPVTKIFLVIIHFFTEIKNYKLIDDEGDDLLDVKLQCSKKLDDAMNGFTPKEAKKVMDEVLKRLMNIGLVKV